MPVHLLVVHFPIALFVVGALADLGGALASSPQTRRAAGWLLILGALAALVAFVTGQGALTGDLTIPGPRFARVEAHTQWGGAGVWVLAGAGMLRAVWRNRLYGGYGWGNVAVALAAAALAVAITLSGTAISHAP